MARIIKSDEMKAAGAPRAAVLNLVDLAEEARRVVLEARKDAARITAKARQGSEAADKQAAERGYAEGLARGRNDGYADGERLAVKEMKQKWAAESAKLASLVRDAVGRLDAARTEVVNQARDEMVTFALEVAAKIVGRVAAADVAAARSNLAKALKLADLAGQITVNVNPGQLAALEESARDVFEAFGVTGRVRLVADNDVSAGGVKLVSRGGEIDATIETQLANVADALVGHRAGSTEIGRYESSAQLERRQHKSEIPSEYV